MRFAIIRVFLDLFTLYYSFNPTKKHQFFQLLVLSGPYHESFIHDIRRLTYAKKMAGRLHNCSIQIIFSGYDKITPVIKTKTAAIFDKKFSFQVCNLGPADKVNTKIQLNYHRLHNQNFRGQVIVISDWWHLPRIKYYLNIFNLSSWNVYSEFNFFQFPSVISEIVKIIKYSKMGDLEIR